jgi:hypothetical protein
VATAHEHAVRTRNRTGPGHRNTSGPARVRLPRAGQLRAPLRLLRPGTVLVPGTTDAHRQPHQPRRNNTNHERIDHCNGLAACPTHDVAFDIGLLSVDNALQIHSATRLNAVIDTDDIARRYFGRPPLRDTLALPTGADPAGRQYLDWHHSTILAA